MKLRKFEVLFKGGVGIWTDVIEAFWYSIEKDGGLKVSFHDVDNDATKDGTRWYTTYNADSWVRIREVDYDFARAEYRVGS